MVRGRGLAGAARRGGEAALALLLLAAAACAPRLDLPGPEVTQPRLETAAFVAADGRELAVRRYGAAEPDAVIVAAHGFNDYGHAFEMAGEWFADNGIALVAYDQRGFGETPTRGVWPGTDALADDYAALVRAVHAAMPETPLFLMGVSMGGAVATVANARHDLPGEGLILSGPAFWGWSQMNPFYRAGLWTMAHVAPGYRLTGEGLGRWPSDNIEMLRALSRDPLMIRETRVDTLYGLVTLMDDAYAAAPEIEKPTLVLFGEKDEIVPGGPVENVAKRLGGPTRFARYPEGWHMLLRDLQREVVYRDIAAWMADRAADLPSGAEVALSAD